MKYFIGGVNGSGKTTLLLKVKEAMPHFQIIKGSQMFMDFLGISGDYEALRALSHEFKLNKKTEMIGDLVKIYDEMILDSHYLNLVRGEVKEVTGEWISKFDALLLLDVSPKTALERVDKDTRDRTLFPDGISEEEKCEMYAQYILKASREAPGAM